MDALSLFIFAVILGSLAWLFIWFIKRPRILQFIGALLVGSFLAVLILFCFFMLQPYSGPEPVGEMQVKTSRPGVTCLYDRSCRAT